MNSGSRRTSVESRFSAAASTYDGYSEPQATAADKALALLTGIPEPKHILEIGCGTGLLTQRLLKMYADTSIDAVDISGSMLAEARNRSRGIPGIQWVEGDIRDIELEGTYDLVISSSSLHWILPLEVTLSRAFDSLNDGGCLVFSMMLKDTLCELRASWQRAAPEKPIGRELPSRDEVITVLDNCGYRLVSSSCDSLKVRYSSAREFLKSIHEQGVTGGSELFQRATLNRSELDELIRDYDRHYSEGKKGVFATYEILSVSARKENG